MAITKCPECGQEVSTFAKVCPNCGCPNVNDENANEPVAQEVSFGEKIPQALLHFLLKLVYFLFILPFDLWKKAIIRLYDQRKNHTLDADKIKHEVPFFVWIKRYLFDFLLDGMIAICWLIGLYVIYLFFKNIEAIDYIGVGSYLFSYLLIPLYCVYWLPATITIIRDAITLFIIMPIRWMFSFLRRPAKTYDLTHTNGEKR